MTQFYEVAELADALSGKQLHRNLYKGQLKGSRLASTLSLPSAIKNILTSNSDLVLGTEALPTMITTGITCVTDQMIKHACSIRLGNDADSI